MKLKLYRWSNSSWAIRHLKAETVVVWNREPIELPRTFWIDVWRFSLSVGVPW